MSGKELTAAEMSLVGCHTCGKVYKIKKDIPKGYIARCSRCHAALHQRKTNSIARTWALLLTAAILYIPSNVCPILTSKTPGGPAFQKTIIAAVHLFWETDMKVIAAIIFTASILVPITKIVTLSFLLLSIQFKWNWYPKYRTEIYRLVENIGRWSMVDVFVVSMSIVLLKFGVFLDTKPQVGVLAFASVVVITMFAALSFDPRLIWDNYREEQEENTG